MSGTPGTSCPARVAVVGAGTMGPGIALAFALAGADVRLTTRRPRTLDEGARRLDAGVSLLTGHGRVDAAKARARVRFDGDLASAAEGVDLVVETIVEDLGAKQDLLARIADAAPADAVIATNTSSLSLHESAEAVPAPGRFAAMHWFNPAELVALVEVVAAPATTDAVLDRLTDWAIAAGKRPIRLNRAVPGFVANRLQYALIREAHALVADGVCDYEAIDAAMTAGLGARWAAVGPIASMDLAGLDVHLSVAAALFPSLAADDRAPAAVRDAVAAGRLGVKTGDGLRGRYAPVDVEALAAHRLRTLLALGALADDAASA